MISIFSAMRPFRDGIAVVQLQAIRCWLALRPKCEVILVDDEEETTTEATKELEVKVVTGIRRSKLGAPLLDDLLRAGAVHARNDVLAYNTADVLLPPDFVGKVSRLHSLMRNKAYLAVGSRTDLPYPVPLTFEGLNWFSAIHEAVRKDGVPHGHTAADLWVYPRSYDLAPPPFPIGRHLTDGWAIYNARKNGVPVIDLTGEVLLVHQYHERPAKRSPLFLEEQLECVRLFEKAHERALSVLDAEWIYQQGELRRPAGLRRLHSALSLNPAYRWLVGMRRKHNRPHLYLNSI